MASPSILVLAASPVVGHGMLRHTFIRAQYSASVEDSASPCIDFAKVVNVPFKRIPPAGVKSESQRCGSEHHASSSLDTSRCRSASGRNTPVQIVGRRLPTPGSFNPPVFGIDIIPDHLVRPQ